ncbi:unnamed protein product [Cuscuta epithymum]|uniref:RING-type domain-containing protein n=1 Tax=Cuscuta epithymum TaxID=186058 RepID=A0AAV0EIC9_9ASTE|nr:unnamed protein product [Cuscuta epithymum]
MAVQANRNIFLQELSDFIPLSGDETFPDLADIKPMITGFQGILPSFNVSPPSTAPEYGIGGYIGNQGVTRKRRATRDSIKFSPVFASQKIKNQSFNQNPYAPGNGDFPALRQYEVEIDRIVSQHAKKLKVEIEKRNEQIMTAVIGEGLMKKLSEKEAEIQRMWKWNLALQERVKNLDLEKQLWRDMAHKKAAAADCLRANLDKLLSSAAAVNEDSASSCCGSSGDAGGGRVCRRCGVRESSVLLLPCRHLCLCAMCFGSIPIDNCPVCNSNANASLHVNSSSD